MARLIPLTLPKILDFGRYRSLVTIYRRATNASYIQRMWNSQSRAHPSTMVTATILVMVFRPMMSTMSMLLPMLLIRIGQAF
jgi:hypothetical protein